MSRPQVETRSLLFMIANVFGTYRTISLRWKNCFRDHAVNQVPFAANEPTGSPEHRSGRSAAALSPFSVAIAAEPGTMPDEARHAGGERHAARPVAFRGGNFCAGRV